MNALRYFFRSLRRPGVWAVAGLLAAMTGCEKPKPVTLTMPVLPPRAVSVATVTTRDVPQFLAADGQTTASQSVNIVSQVEGQIKEMPFQQGTLVKKDDILVQIDPELFDAAVKRAQGQVETDAANYKLANGTLERTKLMLPEKLVSQQQIDVLDAQLAAIKGQQAVDEAILTTARINLAYTTIRAPIDGMVGTFRINVGNVVKVNDVPITTIQTMSPIYADFSISETDFPLLRKYFDANNGKLPVMVISLSDAKQQQSGELTILSNAVAAPTGSVMLRATLPNSDRLFWPNQPVQVRILLDTLRNAVVVPEDSILMSQQGEFVFVVGKAAKPGDLPPAEMRVVQTGQTQDDGMKVITSGLKPGEQVVVEGQLFLAPTMPLIVKTLDGKDVAPAPGAAAGSGGTTPAPTAPAAASGSGTGGKSY